MVCDCFTRGHGTLRSIIIIMKCNQCGSTELVEDVGVVDRADDNRRWDLTLVTHRKPSAWVFKGSIEATVRAKVCCSCGYVMLFANPSDVAKLKDGNSPSF